jgi:CubicO group peptidase (beta-lactamase class C family)
MTRDMTPPTSLSHARLEAIEHHLDRDIAAGKIAGAEIAVGWRGCVVYERSVGFRDAASRDMLQPGAVWRIYSMTKPVVTAAAMVLVERGELRLDQPVAEHLPESPAYMWRSQTAAPCPAIGRRRSRI